MAEYIEREAVKAAVRKRLNSPTIIGWLCRIIDACAAADVAPVVHGHREEIEPTFIEVDAQCCRCGIPMGSQDNYCPSCGARMDGE